MMHNNSYAQGSFTLRDIGLVYGFESENKIINISRASDNKALAYLACDRHISNAPLPFVQAISKTNQVKALMYSQNQTADLTEALTTDRLGGIIHATALVSKLAVDLEQAHYHRFTRLFCKSFDLENLKITQFQSHSRNTSLFSARIYTKNGNSTLARADSLPNLLNSLAHNVLHDLMITESRYHLGGCAQSLLNIASKLSTIACVLDTNFIPEHKVERLEKLKTHLETIRSNNKKRLKNSSQSHK